MGSKGQTTTTSQNQTYTPTGGAAIQGALGKAQNAANLPFNIPQAPVAGFSADQQNAFQNVNNAQGMAQPYINQAQNYFNQSAQQPDVASFYNPMAANVTAQMQNIFGQQNSQNTGQLTQAAGGVGADRIAVGQGNLANQQGLAAGQTYANLWQQAQGAAQQQQNALQSAGYGTAALGSQAQNAALQGAQAQLGTGGLQQQLSQAQMNSPYQQQLAQAAFPYQQAQFLAGITGSLAPGLGGTTQGTGTQTSPGPSIWSQLLGLGTAGVGAAGGMGAFGGSPSYGGGSAAKGDAYGGSGSAPLQGLTASDYGPGYFVGGGVNPFAEGGGVSNEPIDIAPQSIIPDIKSPSIQPHIPQLNLTPQPSGGGGGGGSGAGDIAKIAQMAMMFMARGGGVNPFAEGGAAKDQTAYGDDQSGFGNEWSAHYREHNPNMGPSLREQDAQTSSRAKKPQSSPFPGYAKGGTPSPLDDAEWPSGPEGGPSPLDTAQWPSGPEGGPSDVVNFGDPIRRDPEADNAWRQSADATMPVAFTGNTPPTTRGTSKPAAAAPPPAAAQTAAPGASPAPAAAPGARPESGGGDDFIKSPWAALMAAGLGIAGGTSPFAGVNIGQGGLQGLKMLQQQRTESQKDTTIEQAAKRLEQEAKFHEDQYTRATPYQQFEMKKPQVIGKNLYGQPVMGVLDPTTGAYVDPVTKNPVDISQIGEAGEEQIASMAKGIANYNQPPPSPFKALTPVGMAVMSKAKEINPLYDAKNYGEASAAKIKFGSGPQGDAIRSFGTSYRHIDLAEKLIDAMNNGDSKLVNSIKNEWKTVFGTSSAPNNFESAKAIVSDEIIKAVLGSRGALGDRSDAQSKLDAATSPKLLHDVIRNVYKPLMIGQLQGYKQQYEAATHGAKDFGEKLSPEVAQDLDKAVAASAAKAQQGAIPAGGEAAGAAPQVGERKQFKQGWGMWNGSAWVPATQ